LQTDELNDKFNSLQLLAICCVKSIKSRALSLFMQVEIEKKLIKQVLLGNQQAFKTLVQQYERLVLHIVTPLTGVTEDREDICQEVFIKVYKGLSSFKHDSLLSTWIGNIAYNTCLNFLRKKKMILIEDILRTDADNEHNQGEHPLAFIRDSNEANNPERRLEKKEALHAVADAINELPEMQKLTIILFHYDELSLQEIGQILNIPENTVKSYLFRGRNKLKELINH
jgi:RNA polymerase sigma-70 factor (ECF subfamily)